MRLVAVAVGSALIASACTAGAPTPSQSGTQSSTTIASAPASASATDSDIVGYWHRAQSCEELLTTFEAAGLTASHREWLQGNFFGGAAGPTSGDECAGAVGPIEHSHWFTADGQFGSHDENGEEVDSGDYVSVDGDTLSFPSHASEFGHDGDLVVDYAIADDIATFDVALPVPCEAACKDAYAWALSAFSSGPWEIGDVP